MKTYLSLLFLAVSFGLFSQWEQKTNLPAAGRNHPVTFSINGIGYVTTGGNDGPPFYFDDMWKYNPATDSWSPLGDFPGGDRSFAYGVEHGGYGYAGFGASDDGFNVTYYDDWYRQAPYLHKSVGVMLALVFVFRLIWRYVNPKPKLDDSVARWEERVAGLVLKTLLLRCCWAQ